MGSLGICVTLALIFSQATGIFLTIEPNKIQYTGDNDVTIRCELGESDMETIGWMQISKQNLLMKKSLFLSLRVIDGTGPEWGSGIDDEKMDGKTSVRYSFEPPEETYLEVTLHQIECEDKGIYSCEVFGTDRNESMIKDMIREELVVYSTGDKPSITYFSAKVPNQELMVTPGSELTLHCSGMVGKPPVPITWYQFSDKAGVFLRLKKGVSVETLMVEKDNTCSYNGSRYLTFTAPPDEREITFRCGIGPLFDTITVVSAYTMRTSFSRIFDRGVPNHETDADTENGNEKELLLSISPSKVQYQGYFDVTIKCSIGDLGENLTQFGYIQLQKEGPVSLKRPYLTLRATNGTAPKWGSGFNSTVLESKSTVTYQRYPLNESFIQVILHRMECDDEGIYTCVLFGIDNDNNMLQKRVREELSIYTYAGEPLISFNDQRFPTKEMHAPPGVNLTLTCSGPVGKPLVPIQWYKYDMMAGAYVYTTIGMGQETSDLPMDHLCRYTGTSTMTFFTTAFEHEVTYECKIGAFADTITVIMDGRSNDIAPSFSHQKQTSETKGVNSAELQDGSHVLCTILTIIVWLNTKQE